MHRALHTGQRPLAPLHDRPAGLGEGGHEHDDERQHGQQDHEADAAGIERGGPRTHAHGGWRAALRHGVDLAFHHALLEEQHDGDDGDRHHRHGALERGAAAHFADERVVGHHRQQRHAAATQQFSHLPKAVAEETRQRFAFTLTAYRDFQLQFALLRHCARPAGAACATSPRRRRRNR
ncbi:hypothetical protein G6F22_019377 [Rhizopus arrhizus]|nr:hypothetical protein G6F22_019377 [Rhizopus arrhizus]